jgi:type I restriction enzyme M protein
MTTTTSQNSLTSIIKRSRDIMRKDAGLNGDADRTPQLAWLLFLKAFDDLELNRQATDRTYQPVIAAPYRWQDWAASSVSRRSGDALLSFVGADLLPHLKGLTGTGRPGDPSQTVADIFSETRNNMLSGYLLADLVDEVNKVNFTSSDDIHTMAHFYESMLREMRDAAGDAGEFYTPRPVVRFITGRVDPHPGEIVLDPAVGTGGFLVEAWDHLVQQATTATQRASLRGTMRGFEKKPTPYLLGQMNLLLHEVDQPRITLGNALTSSIADQRRDGVDVVLTNPPFGGAEESSVKDFYPTGMQSTETSWLFLQSVMARIEKSAHGRAGIVVPNSVLFDTGIGGRIKKKLMQEFTLHTVVRMPNGTFAPYTLIPTNLLFFERGGPTKDVWFYEHPLPEGRKNYTKTKPLRYEEFADAEAWWGGPTRQGRVETPQAWRVSAQAIADDNYNLDLHNPNRPDDLEHRDPLELLDDMLATERQLITLLEDLRVTLGGQS